MSNFKCFLIFFLFVCAATSTLGAEVSVSYTTINEDCNKEGWRVEYQYISKIVVMKEHNEEVTINLGFSESMRAWNTGNGMKNKEGSFKNTVKGDIEDKKITLDTTSKNKDRNNKYYKVSESIISGKDVSLKVKVKKDNGQRGNRVGMSWSRQLYIPADVNNGEYNYYFETDFHGSKPNPAGIIQIVSLPEITVGDIDFGQHPSNTYLTLNAESPITIVGGTPDMDYNLSTDPLVELIKAGTTETIPVNMSIEFHNGQRLDSSGNSSAKLKAGIDSVSPSTSGVYIGTATVIFNYN